MGFSFLHALRSCEGKLARLSAGLRSMDPAAVLGPGYSITYTAAGEVLREGAQVRAGGKLRTTLARGEVHSEVRTGGGSGDLQWRRKG